MHRSVALACLLSILSPSGCLQPNFFYPHPFYNALRYYDPYYEYSNQLTPILPVNILNDKVLTSYSNQPDSLPPLNILAETPFQIKNDFTVVPMLVMAKENMRMILRGDVIGVSAKQPLMTIRGNGELMQCLPAVKIILAKPILVYSLKTSIVFPSEFLIHYTTYSIPIQVGAVIAPVAQDVFVSTQHPVAVNVVYAVPTVPFKIDAMREPITPDNQAIVVESSPINQPPLNVTIIDFPEKEAEPVLVVDEEDDELVNRNPPQVLAPAGIVQSTQPKPHVSTFLNSKESPVLTALREEALKRA